LTVSEWSDSEGGTVARSAAQAIVGSYSMLVTPAGASATLINTTSRGDLSAYLTNTTGVVGIWIYVSSTTNITAITLRIGSSAGNYCQVSGVICGVGTLAFPATGWNYVIFRLSTGTITGSPDWTAVDYTRLAFTFDTSPGSPFYLDYHTCGDGDIIGLNGLGERLTTLSTTTTTW
jgi:hypothetical protein